MKDQGKEQLSNGKNRIILLFIPFMFGRVPGIIILIILLYFFNKELAKNGYTIKDLFSSNGSEIRQEFIVATKKKYGIEYVGTKEENSEQKIDNGNQVNKNTNKTTTDQQNEMTDKIVKAFLNQQDKRGLFIMIKAFFIFFAIAFAAATISASSGLEINMGFREIRATITSYITTPTSTSSPRIRIIIGIIVILVIVKVVTDIQKTPAPKPLPEGKIEKPGI